METQQRTTTRSNLSWFCCPICSGSFAAGDIVAIEGCSHSFCRNCLSVVIKSTDRSRDSTGYGPPQQSPQCPHKSCKSAIDDRQIRRILSVEDYMAYLKEPYRTQQFGYSFICGSCRFEKCIYNNIASFPCPKCGVINCRLCRLVHSGINCVVYKDLRNIKNAPCASPMVQDPIDCVVCGASLLHQKYEAWIMSGCSHAFCRDCLKSKIKRADYVDGKCPYKDNDGKPCESQMSDRDIRNLLHCTADYMDYLERSFKQKCDEPSRTFFCKTRNCLGVYRFECGEQLRGFRCPKCNVENCVLCNTIHVGLNCKEHRAYQDFWEDFKKSSAPISLTPSKKKVAIKGSRWNLQQYLQELNMKEHEGWLECPICLVPFEVRNVIQMDNCYHTVCRKCLIDTVKRTEFDEKVRCPHTVNNESCKTVLPDRRIRHTLKLADYMDCLKQRFGRLEGAYSFKCNAPNCNELHNVDGNLTMCRCIKCDAINCRLCDAVHDGMNCVDYRDIRDSRKAYGSSIVQNDIYCSICRISLRNKSYEDAVVIPDCSHGFCRAELAKIVKQERFVDGKCPVKRCNRSIPDQLIRRILSSDEYMAYLVRTFKYPAIQCSFECQKEGCTGVYRFWLTDCRVYSFFCPICNSENCLLCKSFIGNAPRRGDQPGVRGLHGETACIEYRDLHDSEFQQMRLTVRSPPDHKPTQIVSTCPEVWEKMWPKVPTASNMSSSDLKRMKDVSKKEIAGPARQNPIQVESNPKPFECPICFIPCEAPQLVTLRGCLHRFCRECLANTVKHAVDVLVKCPSKVDNVSCQSVIQDVHIRDLLSDADYRIYLKRSSRKSQGLTDNGFHCGTPDCTGWCVVQGNATSFRCSVCNSENCLQCKAQHAGTSCQDYQSTRDRSKDPDLDNMIALGTALRCPKCNCLLTKIDGCDYVRCGVCQTAICWVTQGPRWGPEGEGDTSGGCRCGVGGKLCHPCCSGCHHA